MQNRTYGPKCVKHYYLCSAFFVRISLFLIYRIKRLASGLRVEMGGEGNRDMVNFVFDFYDDGFKSYKHFINPLRPENVSQILHADYITK